MKLLRSVTVLMISSLVGFTCGCASLAGDDPRDMLNQTVSSLIGEDDFSFEGTAGLRISDAQLDQDFAFTGYVTGHNEIFIEPNTGELGHGPNNAVKPLSGKLYYAKVNKQWTTDQGSEKQLNPLYTWNPIIQLEHLNRLAGESNVEGSRTASGHTILHAVTTEDQLLKQVKEQIRRDHETVIAAARKQADEVGNAQLQAELIAYVQQAEARLKEILDSLQLTSQYELAVQDRSRRLRDLNVQARLEYDLEGQRRVETIVKTYHFQY